MASVSVRDLSDAPFPDYVSGHSTYGAAAARLLSLSTGSDLFGNSVLVLAGSSKIEPAFTPKQGITLRWNTFTDAAREAGMSRRYGGLHFMDADIAGQQPGKLVAEKCGRRRKGYSMERRRSYRKNSRAYDRSLGVVPEL